MKQGYNRTMRFKKLPCKNCILLPTCIIKFKEFRNRFESSTIMLDAYEFPRDKNSRCSLLMDYFDSQYYHVFPQVYNVYRLKTFANYMYKHID